MAEYNEESIKFLERDFNQSFEQMRHYDKQITELYKFIFTIYISFIGASFGLVQFGMKEKIDFTLVITTILGISLITGTLTLSLLIRNRVYFVQVVRYINEHRGFFLKNKPLGFENLSKMYINHMQPPFFNWRSSHSWFIYMSATMNTIILSILIYFNCSIYSCFLYLIIISCVIFLIIQLMVSIVYLKTRENKSASEAVFGNK